MPISSRIRTAILAINAAGTSQDEIARRAGTTQPQLSLWLAGKKQFNEAALDRLAEVAGLTVESKEVEVDTEATTT